MKELIPIIPAEDKTLMEELLRAGQIKYKYATRIQIVMQRAVGKSAREIADNYGVGRSSVSVIVKRYNEGGIELLLRDKTRKPGKKPISEELKNEICKVACTEKPEGATHWSVRALARRFHIGKTTINMILRERNIKPHLDKSFQYSTDIAFEEKLTDVVGLYMNPPDNAIVYSVDEKTEIQALERTQPLLPLSEHVPACHTADYERHGTTTLFAALSMLTGNVIGDCRDKHKSADFIAFLKQIDEASDKDKVLHIIVDNYSSHKSKETNEFLKKSNEYKDRFVLHFIPTHSSWLNMVERWFAEITNKQIRRESWESVEQLIDAIKRFIETWNQSKRIFVWHKSASQILDNIAKSKQAHSVV
jgi:transposase